MPCNTAFYLELTNPPSGTMQWITISNTKTYGRKFEMRLSLALQTHREAIRQIARRHHVKQVRVCGSVLHGEDTEKSDLDLLVEPTPATTLMDIGAIRYELRQLLGIPVNVLTPKALPDNCREQILSGAELV